MRFYVFCNERSSKVVNFPEERFKCQSGSGASPNIGLLKRLMAEVVVTTAIRSSDDPMGFPCRASVAALGIYLLLRMCEEVLKALIIGRRSAAMKNQASAKKFEEEVVQKRNRHPPKFGYQAKENVIIWMRAARD